jgi:hypothetical protein
MLRRSRLESVATDIVQAGQRLFTTGSKGFERAFEGFGMNMENGTNCISILATVKRQDCVQALGNSAIIGLFETVPHILAPIAAQGKQLLAHGLFL